MTVKKFKFFTPSNMQKEEQWLTEMSKEGLHFNKYRLGMYYFEEDSAKSYVYQIDFRDADDDYFELYKDSGWDHVESFIDKFHYFRTSAEKETQKIYSDRESVKDTFQRMMQFYLVIFLALFGSQAGLLVTWKGYVIQIVAACIGVTAILLYFYVFLTLRRKIDFYNQ